MTEPKKCLKCSEPSAFDSGLCFDHATEALLKKYNGNITVTSRHTGNVVGDILTPDWKEEK